jgi:CheY-like chemotaxis protein
MPLVDVTLLIADADALWRDRFRDFFSQYGFTVETAADGLECLTKLRVFEPDVLIVELDMPWGGGDGVIARLNEDVRLTKAPAVLAVGSAPPETLAARVGLPHRRCYQKPVRMERMMDSVCLPIALAAEERQLDDPG